MQFKLINDGVLVATFHSLKRLKKYIDDNFTEKSLEVLREHGYTIREDNDNESDNRKV